MDKNEKKIYKLVLTGGPCGGKTTGQARVFSFFESLGWRVYRVPECATVLMSGGRVKWQDLDENMAFSFQCNLVRCMLQIEQTYIDLAMQESKNCLVVCDRGAMDPSAYMTKEDWDRLKEEVSLSELDLRDTRYDQVIHMVSAAKGAEDFYTTEDHSVRYEDAEAARHLDDLVSQAWVGHPYFDVVDNSTDFETKVTRMIATLCFRLGLDLGDRLNVNSKKRKFLVASLPDTSLFAQSQDFDVAHDYLVTPSRKMQARIRKRGQNGSYTYSHTIRRPEINKQVVEVKQQITGRDYQNLLVQRDSRHITVFKTRRCFLWQNQYYQMDIYKEPCHPRCKGLIFLETYTTTTGDMLPYLPDFLTVTKEVTGDPQYSMFNLSLKDGHKQSVLMSGCRANTKDCIDIPKDVITYLASVKECETGNVPTDTNHNGLCNGVSS